jgi:hypothetical protein
LAFAFLSSTSIGRFVRLKKLANVASFFGVTSHTSSQVPPPSRPATPWRSCWKQVRRHHFWDRSMRPCYPLTNWGGYPCLQKAMLQRSAIRLMVTPMTNVTISPMVCILPGAYFWRQSANLKKQRE